MPALGQPAEDGVFVRPDAVVVGEDLKVSPPRAELRKSGAQVRDGLLGLLLLPEESLLLLRRAPGPGLGWSGKSDAAQGRLDGGLVLLHAEDRKVTVVAAEAQELGLDCNLICSNALYPKNIGRVSMETAWQLLEGEVEPGVRIETFNALLTPENADTFEDLLIAQ